MTDNEINRAVWRAAKIGRLDDSTLQRLALAIARRKLEPLDPVDDHWRYCEAMKAVRATWRRAEH